jgi:hypothetical protein
MYLSYKLKPVDLKRSDLEFLWSKIAGDLFEETSNNLKRESIECELAATTKAPPSVETIREKSLKDLLDSGHLSPSVGSLSMRFSAHYSPGFSPGAVQIPSDENRMLSLTFDEKRNPSVELDGTRQWTDRALGFLNTYFEKKKRNAWKMRIAFGAGWLLLPVGPLLGILQLAGAESIEYRLYLGLYFFIGYIFLSSFAADLFPTSLIVVDETSLRIPWYVKGLGAVWIGVLTSLIASSIILTAGFG